jgi:hypothetical protein
VKPLRAAEADKVFRETASGVRAGRANRTFLSDDAEKIEELRIGYEDSQAACDSMFAPKALAKNFFVLTVP